MTLTLALSAAASVLALSVIPLVWYARRLARQAEYWAHVATAAQVIIEQTQKGRSNDGTE